MAVVYAAVDFKQRKPGTHSAGVAIYWGECHECNKSFPLRATELTPVIAQLTGKELISRNCAIALNKKIGW